MLGCAMNDELQRDVGRMEAELESLKFSLDEMRIDVKEMRAELQRFSHTFAEMRGGYKTVIGFAALVGALITAFGQWLVTKVHA